MTGDGLFELRRRTTLVRGINPRGARHWGAASRHQTCMRQVRLDPDHDAVMLSLIHISEPTRRS